MATDFTSLLADQVGNEFAASQQYIAVASWFERQTLPELAAFFYQQAVEERNHAMMLLKFQMDTDRVVAVPGIAPPKSDFATATEPVVLALAQERRVTEQITALANAARAESDYQAEQFMQWFLKEQVEEVASMKTLLNIADRAGHNLFDLEQFVAREMNTSVVADAGAPTVAGGSL